MIYLTPVFREGGKNSGIEIKEDLFELSIERGVLSSGVEKKRIIKRWIFWRD